MNSHSKACFFILVLSLNIRTICQPQFFDSASFYFNNYKYEKAHSFLIKIEPNKLDNINLLVEYYYLISYNSYKLFKLEDAQYYVNKQLKLLQKIDTQKPIHKARAFHLLGKICYSKHNIKKAISYFENCIQILISQEQIDSSLVMRSYLEIALTHIRNNNFVEPNQCFKNALKYLVDIDRARYFNYLSHYHFCLDDYETSLKFSQKALESSAFNNRKNKTQMIYALMDMGATFSEIADYEKGFLLLNKALRLQINQYGSINSNTALIYSNLGYNRLKTQNYTEAIMHYKKSYEIDYKLYKKLPLNITRKYLYIGDTFGYLKKPDSSFYYYNLAHEVAKKYTSHPFTARVYEAFGKYYHQLNQSRASINNYLHAIKIEKRTEIFGVYQSRLYQQLAQVYQSADNYDSAFYCIQQAVITSAIDFDNEDIKVNPPITKYKLGDPFLYALLTKAQIVSDYYHKQSKDLNYLKLGLETYQQAIKLTDSLRFSFQSEASKLELAKITGDVFRGAVENSVDLYNITGDNQYLMLAFEMGEKSKAAVLHSELKQVEARKYGDLPDTIAAYEEQLRQDIALFKSQVNRLAKGEQTEEKKSQLERYKDTLYILKRDYGNLLTELEQKFPKYYQLKYASPAINLEKLQKSLATNQKIITYIEGKDRIIAFVVSNNAFEVVTNDKRADFTKNINQLRASISSSSFITDPEANWREYTSSAQSLYKVLVQPLERVLNPGDQLIVIPDGAIALVPFEVLLVNAPPKLLQYDKLDYLIYNYTISYANSNTLWLKNQHSVRNGEGLLAFAPEFVPNNSNKNSDRSAETQVDTVRGSLVPLEWAKKELEGIKKYFNSKVVTDEFATEMNFKKEASKYKILHIATHANANDQDPMYSRIYFTQSQDSLDDAALHTFELYNLSLNAELAVLSACNTGYGQAIQGEGVLNLARGFTYAGCPSVVMSLWNANDRTTAEIMQHFYKFLAKGEDKASALRSAKLAYLKQADVLKSHPYFWGQFVATGSTKSVTSPNQLLWIVLAIGVLLIFGVISWRLRQKRFQNP